MQLDVYKLIGKGYEKARFTNNDARYIICCGGRNTKKSTDLFGYEPIFKLLMDKRRNILMVRQNDSDNAQSTYANLLNILESLGLNGTYFKCSVNPRQIVYKLTGQKIVFRGLNNPTGLTSIKFETGYLTDIYFEEGSEIKSYDSFRKVDGSLRGRDIPLQIHIAMNPWDINHWTYEIFFKGRLEDNLEYLETHDYMDYYDPDFDLGFGKGLYLHKSTYKINEFRDRSYDKSMLYLREHAPEIYKVEGLGMWGNSTESTYPEMSDGIVIPRHEANTKQFVDFAIGIDTGLSNGEGKLRLATDERRKSATTMELIGLTSDYKSLICLKEFYFSNEGALIKKTEPQLVEEILDKITEWIEFYKDVPILMKNKIMVYVDIADTGFRQNLELSASKREGFKNVIFVGSTKIPIITRVAFTRLLMAWGNYLISEECSNLIRELKNSKRGQKGEVREDFDDHSINANEYAWAPMRKRIQKWGNFKSPS